MSSNNTSNAPMPSAAPAAAAETFDSTVAPPQGNVSAIGIPGPDNREAPIHAGMVNGIDPFFSRQYVALEQFTWTTSQDPATLLFYRAIHPRRSHQWIDYLSYIYNTFAGGFDFAFKVAGTGFHAGGIYLVRLPPNIKPDSLKTEADITGFEYFVIDPKTLEVEVKSCMDQRNVMFHWMTDFDLNRPETFGGFIAAYVMLPLNTSSTGATSIQVQVFTKPSQNFMFSQVRPLRSGPAPVNPIKDLVEAALDFTKIDCPVQFNRGAAYTLDLTPKYNSCYDIFDVIQADTTYYYDRKFYNAPYQGLINAKISGFKSTNIKKSRGSDGWFGLTVAQGSSIVINIDDSETKNQIPFHYGGRAYVTISFKGAPEATATFYANCSQEDNGTKFTFNNVANRDYFKISKKEIPGWDDGTPFQDKFDDWFSQIFVTKVDNGNTSMFIDHPSQYFAPPGQNEIVFRPSAILCGSQFSTIKHLFSTGRLKNDLHSGEAIFLELHDADAELPVGKFKLYFEGFMTGPNVQNVQFYNFFKKRYYFKFLKIGSGNTPLYANASEMNKYRKNRALAKLFSPEME
nr:MAG: coat protein [Spider picorna-like virus 7]